MEAENKQYANMHGDGQGQPTANTPLLHQQGQSQGYPQYGPPTAPATPYYAPPSGAGYGVGYGITPSQQPQNQVIVVGTNQSPVVRVQPAESFVAAIIYSCFVFWCCGFLFGLIGFILAVEGSNKAATDVQGARKLKRASYIVSSVGIVVILTFTAISLALTFGYFCKYQPNGECYRHFSPDMSREECEAKDGVYVDGIGCYYN